MGGEWEDRTKEEVLLTIQTFAKAIYMETRSYRSLLNIYAHTYLGSLDGVTL